MERLGFMNHFNLIIRRRSTKHNKRLRGVILDLIRAFVDEEIVDLNDAIINYCFQSTYLLYDYNSGSLERMLKLERRLSSKISGEINNSTLATDHVNSRLSYAYHIILKFLEEEGTYTSVSYQLHSYLFKLIHAVSITEILGIFEEIQCSTNLIKTLFSYCYGYPDIESLITSLNFWINSDHKIISKYILFTITSIDKLLELTARRFIWRQDPDLSIVAINDVSLEEIRSAWRCDGQIVFDEVIIDNCPFVKETEDDKVFFSSLLKTLGLFNQKLFEKLMYEHEESDSVEGLELLKMTTVQSLLNCDDYLRRLYPYLFGKEDDCQDFRLQYSRGTRIKINSKYCTVKLIKSVIIYRVDTDRVIMEIEITWKTMPNFDEWLSIMRLSRFTVYDTSSLLELVTRMANPDPIINEPLGIEFQ